MTRPKLLISCFTVLALGCGTAGPEDAGPVCQDCDRDAGAPRDAASSIDASSTDASGPRDAAAPSIDAAEGATCNLNRECAASQRCQCDVTTGCTCTTGARGTGVNGVDTCVDGDACESSLCVEGADRTFYCSDECASDAECEAALPRCLDIAFLGRICARTPPDAGP